MIWPSADNRVLWQQDDDNVSCCFRLHEVNGEKCESLPAASLDLLLGAKSHPATVCKYEGSLFPSHFDYCPHCGSEIHSVPTDSPRWLSPYGAGNGLKIIDSEKREKTGRINYNEAGKEFSLPSERGFFAFSVTRCGAGKRLLTAYERNNGVFWVYNQHKQDWIRLKGSTGGDTMPAWSFSVCTDENESSLCVPSDKGPAWITVNWMKNEIEVTQGEGQSIGGIAFLGDYTFAPVLRGERFMLLMRQKDGNTWEECLSSSYPAEVSPSLGASNNSVSFTGIPVVDKDRQRIFWSCRNGYIQLELSANAPPAWSYSPWEIDEYPAEALIELGPPYYDLDSRPPAFYQLCQDHDECTPDNLVYKTIKLGGNPQGARADDQKIVDCGQFLTTGRASFSWTENYWERLKQKDRNSSSRKGLFFPLVEFFGSGRHVLLAGAKPWQEWDEFGVFTDVFSGRGSKLSSQVSFIIGGSGLSEKELFVKRTNRSDDTSVEKDFFLEISKLPELACFIYGGNFHIYVPENNRCFFWPLISDSA